MRVQLADACSGRGRSQGLLCRHEVPGTEGPAISVSADPGIKKLRVSRHSRSACAMCRGPEQLPYFNTDEIRRRPASSGMAGNGSAGGGDDRESCRNKPQRSSRPDGPQHSPARNARPHMAHKGGFSELARLDDQFGPYASVVTGDTDSPRCFALITRQADAQGGDIGSKARQVHARPRPDSEAAHRGCARRPATAPGRDAPSACRRSSHTVLSRGCPRRSSQNDLGHPRCRLRRHPLDHTARRNQCHTRNCSPPRRSSPTRRSC